MSKTLGRIPSIVSLSLTGVIQFNSLACRWSQLMDHSIYFVDGYSRLWAGPPRRGSRILIRFVIDRRNWMATEQHHLKEQLISKGDWGELKFHWWALDSERYPASIFFYYIVYRKNNNHCPEVVTGQNVRIRMAQFWISQSTLNGQRVSTFYLPFNGLLCRSLTLSKGAALPPLIEFLRWATTFRREFIHPALIGNIMDGESLFEEYNIMWNRLCQKIVFENKTNVWLAVGPWVLPVPAEHVPCVSGQFYIETWSKQFSSVSCARLLEICPIRMWWMW